MTKKEKIKEAWGEYYEENKKRIDENGWFNWFGRSREKMKQRQQLLVDNRNLFDKDKYSYRPKELRGIENNNGWIKIKSEEDLPNDDAFYYKICINNKPRNDYSLSVIEIRRYYYNLNNVTHFQKIITNEPIY